jgi:O-methyltransferase
MIIDFVKKHPFFQNVVAALYARVPAMVEHNLGKYLALKKALYLTSLERLPGDYLEFGVFTGSSFVFTVKANRQLRAIADLKTRFFGFDSFSGFGAVSATDKHPFYQDNTFSVDAQKVIRNIEKQTKGAEVTIVPGFFEETLTKKRASEYGIDHARVVFIDCDLFDPALLALEFVRPALQQGTLLLMDDYYSYRGDPTLGVQGAFAEFCRRHQEFVWRRVYDYGFGGIAMIAGRIGAN